MGSWELDSIELIEALKLMYSNIQTDLFKFDSIICKRHYLKYCPMKLEKILDNLNSFEKNSFLKIIDNIYLNKPKNKVAIDKILSDNSKDLKTIDSINISKVFNLVEEEYYEHLASEFVEISSQLDIVTDILTRDGHCIAKIDWFARLYENELIQLNKKLKEFNNSLNDLTSDIEPSRRRDYEIYKACIVEAYQNDQKNNQENKITQDEQSILITLGQKT